MQIALGKGEREATSKEGEEEVVVVAGERSIDDRLFTERQKEHDRVVDASRG